MWNSSVLLTEAGCFAGKAIETPLSYHLCGKLFFQFFFLNKSMGLDVHLNRCCWFLGCPLQRRVQFPMQLVEKEMDHQCVRGIHTQDTTARWVLMSERRVLLRASSGAYMKWQVLLPDWSAFQASTTQLIKDHIGYIEFPS